MRLDLISFQDKAVKELRLDLADALAAYRKRKKTQVVSLQAPTGAGKTIIAAALIEGVYCGMTLADGTAFEEQPDAIFVWLSDSPELNAQSRDKIELKTDKLRFGQCVTIDESSFDMEMLEDGHIYFLNTQKISKSGNLTKHSDGRQYTIWETLDNTISEKADRLYFIIDEAHRGAKSKTAAGTDTTIMQRFIKGYEYFENGVKRFMHSMPVVLGISATVERFNKLIGTTDNVSLQTYVITADDVRSSGLLKDRIAVTYPDDANKNNDMVLLEAAVDEWMTKCVRWHQYTSEQHYANVDPILVIQVRQGNAHTVSETNINDVISKIEEKAGRFKEGEVVHCFGEGTVLEFNGLNIPHAKASEIADNHQIKVVLFKEALSTGWDCPRAETMMSYATRSDPTYIAQLLGRMVRTPLQMRVSRDESLNDVKLYLPYFDEATVEKVIKELNSNEGGDIPTEINGESLAESVYVTYTVYTPKKTNSINPEDYGQTSFLDSPSTSPATVNISSGNNDTSAVTEQPPATQGGSNTSEYHPGETVTVPVSTSGNGAPEEPAEKPLVGKQLTFTQTLDRVAIIDFINSKGFLSYMVRQERINDYLKSLLNLASLLTYNVVYQNALDEVTDEILAIIRAYIDELHDTGKYDELAEQVLQFKLSVQIFDPFGEEVTNGYYDNLILMSDSDLDRQLRNANARLGSFGFPEKYYNMYYYNTDDYSEYKIDCILFAANDDCREKLGKYAKNKLRELSSKYRVAIANKSDKCKKDYRAIMADSAVVSEQIFTIPETIQFKVDKDGEEYEKHLVADANTGIAQIKLTGWEPEFIKEEAKRSDFMCWLRNVDRASWALCLPRDEGSEKKSFYPDFIVVRKDDSVDDGYVVDVLEPHGPQYKDNLSKAKALARYAQEEDRLGRIQLVRKSGGKFVRLELTDIEVRDKVLKAINNDELDHIFDDEGFSQA